MNPSSRAFTLIELLVTIAIVAVLATLASAVLANVQTQAHVAESVANIRQLAGANLAYAADNNGFYCPAQSQDNLIRWHGARTADGEPFDRREGYLSPYFGNAEGLQDCPLLRALMIQGGSPETFELNSGGYGYNQWYIGGSFGNYTQPASLASVPRPASTIMFATTAFARSGGLQEYPYTEPYREVDQRGRLRTRLQPSTHFRANGRAIVAWCDGHVTLEAPNAASGPNYYGGSNATERIGWCGPTNGNGWWNPQWEER